MLAPDAGTATWEGSRAHVLQAIHEPKGLQSPRIPIVVGGNGPLVTWRLAARFADELNLDALMPEDIEAALPVIHRRCEEEGRDPASLRVSVHVWGPPAAAPGAARRQRLRDYASLGLSRAILQGFGAVADEGLLDGIAEDCAAVGMLEAWDT
jgi:alkanesulfonate monooxygenase SsuD/methylene tetrahydromethanopterin reductase-like flavin-dependent oxidoreductase (luciferase family)